MPYEQSLGVVLFQTINLMKLMMTLLYAGTHISTCQPQISMLLSSRHLIYAQVRKPIHFVLAEIWYFQAVLLQSWKLLGYINYSYLPQSLNVAFSTFVNIYIHQILVIFIVFLFRNCYFSNKNIS